MLFRLLAAFVLTMPVAYGQSFYGTATGHPKAGDAAPDLVFSQVLSAPVTETWSPANLSGHVTVLSFFPDTSHNPKPVEAWNKLVDQFADKHVQFVWITREDRQTLMPALAQHPIKGWVLYDPGGTTAKAYGLDMPLTVYIGPNRKIIGFQQDPMPQAQALNAALEGRVVLTRPTPATITSFQEKNLVALDSLPARMPTAQDYRPHFPPSYTVHITQSVGNERGNFSADDYWVLQGITLKQAIEEIYGVSSARVELPSSLDAAKHYNFAMLLPHPEQRAEMKERFKQALQAHFHLAAEHEVRLADVYVVSRDPSHKASLEKLTNLDMSGDSSVGLQMSGDSRSSMEASAPQSLDALFSIAEEGTMDDFCNDLEASLDRPVVNETHLEGRYRIEVNGRGDSKANFLSTLREQTGLVIHPGKRRITFLKFKTVDD